MSMPQKLLAKIIHLFQVLNLSTLRFLGNPAHITHAVLKFYGSSEGLSLTSIIGEDKLVDISYIINSETFQKN